MADTESSPAESLLDACLALVAENGLKNLKMSQVIERSKVSRRTAYKYFGNKHDLVAACYQREGELLFYEAKQAVTECETVEDIFVTAFLCVYKKLPQNPILRTLIHENHDLLASMQQSGRTTMEILLKDINLDIIFQDHPGLPRDIFELSEYWVQVIASFLLLGIGNGKSLVEVEAYVRKRFVPGLRLEEYDIR